MRIVVTGCQGQVGRCLVKRLNERSDIELYALDKTALNIVDGEQVSALLEKIAPDVIINAAAYTAVDKAEQEEDLAFAINCTGPENLAKAAKTNNALLLHISTDYVFDGVKAEPYQELDETNPQTVYGQSKLAGEKQIQLVGCRHVILRTAWVFEEHGHNFVNTMLKLATKPELGIVGDQLGGPTYADDIAAALISMMIQIQTDKKACREIVHFSGAPHCSWFDFAEEIFNTAINCGRLGSSPALKKIATVDYPLPASRPANSMLDCSKIKVVFGIEPSNWKLGLSKVIAFSELEN
ncbi:dTDP-4-dehydrorhamnose reductase [Shewanella submarina]|uniref:dTDP-4-dehydrorhamnose reductase n=1 Tax=Shewanella submarina TaxID=2016376 RepID=A0ABV7GMY5_9GAMM|nr:dTDP-4-dehydrorhamnose reductase [Shewanella submarina]MCL1036534.1 dTDP-4-dehydrorhamnose reductase [Shewanella submarina]